MRYVPTFCLREGMMLGNNLWGERGELILAKDTVLTEDYIERIKKLNYNGIYVEDDLTKISKSLILSTIVSEPKPLNVLRMFSLLPKTKVP
ncbi:hypothetical protein [Acetobacterium sp. KB-1]|jgi:hypothetical protein|uniref:hypothetical protein n=1 Tax=Acetobacterium sp. KB-1 TaxID=2184575 RepID=UPI000DBEB9A6|nr:hypothetical protein [Acetobacterium sp. KB-1]AWW28279.1 hypothetical protein DOZ58_17480 [Acetobacterium sp. KB-1]